MEFSVFLGMMDFGTGPWLLGCVKIWTQTAAECVKRWATVCEMNAAHNTAPSRTTCRAILRTSWKYCATANP